MCQSVCISEPSESTEPQAVRYHFRIEVLLLLPNKSDASLMWESK